MEPLTMAGLAMAGASLVGSIGNWIYQKNATDRAYERDDNAVSRRMLDLQNAGLSPTLAAGSAAGNSAPVNRDLDFSAVEKALSGMQMKANIAQTNAGAELTRNQATSEIWKQQVMQGQINKMVAETTGIDLANQMYNADMLSKINLRNKQADNLIRNAELTQAKTITEQVALDKLKTETDIAKIQRDVENYNMQTLAIDKQVDAWARLGSPFLKNFKGDLQVIPMLTGYNRNAKNLDTSWYWDK